MMLYQKRDYHNELGHFNIVVFVVVLSYIIFKLKRRRPWTSRGKKLFFIFLFV